MDFVSHFVSAVRKEILHRKKDNPLWYISNIFQRNESKAFVFLIGTPQSGR